MRYLMGAIFMLCLATPAFTAEAGFSQGSISALAGPADNPRLPDNRAAMSDSDDHRGGLARYAQNLATEVLPEAVGDGAAPPPEASSRTGSDGFQGGGTFDHFADQRTAQDGGGNALTGAGHEPPDESDMAHYNLMMKAWQKDQ